MEKKHLRASFPSAQGLLLETNVPSPLSTYTSYFSIGLPPSLSGATQLIDT